MTRTLTQQARVRTNTTKDSVRSIQVEAVTFAKLWAVSPGGHPYVDANGKTPPGYENQCAINLSAAIHGAGVEMKSFRGVAVTLRKGLANTCRSGDGPATDLGDCAELRK